MITLDNEAANAIGTETDDCERAVGAKFASNDFETTICK